MIKTKKEKVLDYIWSLKTTWCQNKTQNGGCYGCPLLGKDRCLLESLKMQVTTDYDDDLHRKTLNGR